MQWNDLFSADNPSERTTAFCHRGPQLIDGSTPGLTAIYIRRDFGIYVLYIPRYPVSVSDGWFKLLEKRVSWIIRFDPVPIIPDVKYKNEVNFDIKIRFKAIDGSSQVVFLFILFVEACSDNIYKLNNLKVKKTIIQNVGFI